METAAFAKAARILVDKCAGIKDHDQVLIVTDADYPRSIPESILGAAYASDAETAVFTMSPRESSGATMVGQLPKAIGPAILASDVVFVCTSKRTTTTALRDFRDQMTKEGGRALNLYMFTEEMFARTIPIDYDLIAERVSTVAKLLPETETARMVAPNGTDISYCLKGRRIYAQVNGIARPGTSAHFPAGYVDISPQEGTANGVLVFDGTLNYTYPPITEPIGHIIEPIMCKVKNGKVIEISGGPQAKGLQRSMKTADENASNFGETAIGFNPKALPNTGVMLENERSEGVLMVGLGRNKHVLGNVESNFHFDATILHGTLILDGQVITEDMKFKI
jgi:leucyl aminopeptidase (aminopeptidase T)